MTDPTLDLLWASVYRNLNKKGIQYSIRIKGKVVGYTTEIYLTDVKLKHATPKALERIRNGPREVCAWITGFITLTLPDATWSPLTVDPKKTDCFQDAITGKRIDTATAVALFANGEALYTTDNLT